MASSEGDVLPVGEILSETEDKYNWISSGTRDASSQRNTIGNEREAKESILWGETPPEYAFVRGGGKSVDGVVEGCTPRNGKSEISGYVSGKEECAEAIISDECEDAYPEKSQKWNIGVRNR